MSANYLPIWKSTSYLPIWKSTNNYSWMRLSSFFFYRRKSWKFNSISKHWHQQTWWLVQKLVIIPVFRSSAHDAITGLTKVIPKLEAGLPMYYLYYSDQKFLNDHYQSIRPSHENSPRSEMRSVPEDENSLSIPQWNMDS